MKILKSVPKIQFGIIEENICEEIDRNFIHDINEVETFFQFNSTWNSR